MAQTIGSREPASGTASTPKKRKPFLLDLYGTAVGKKYVMAVTGIIGIGYVIVHMIGNLKMYFGADAEGVYDIDHYGEFLLELLVPLLPHRDAVAAAVRPDRCADPARACRLLADRAQSQGLPGEVPDLPRLHRRQLRQPHDAVDGHHRVAVPGLAPGRPDAGWVNPDFVRGEVYRNVDASLSRWPVALLYIVANIAPASTCSTGCGACSSRWGGRTPVQPVAETSRHRHRHHRGGGQRLVPHRRARWHRRDLTGAHPDERQPREQGPRRPDRRQVGELQVQYEAGQPEQQAQVQDHRRRHRPGWRVSGGDLAELGYQVDAFTFHDSSRRAHSIAAQGGINAAKNYRGDGDSIERLFYDTVKGGDFRSREANVYRLAETSVDIIDQMVAQGVPFAREYGGMLDNRSFGGAQVSRTFYARGQTGQQLLLGAYQQLSRQVGLGGVRLFNRTELVDIVVIDGHCSGIVVRDLLTGEISSHAAHAVVLATGGYGNVFFLSTNAMACNVTAIWRAHRQGAYFANPCYTQIHPTCIPQSDEFQSKLTPMSESLRNDGRVWVLKNADETPAAGADSRRGP